MKAILTILVGTVLSVPAMAKQDICEKVVRAETERLQSEAQKKQSDYTFDGIGDIYQEDDETYVVTFGYNEECQSGYQFLISRGKKSCKILSTYELPGDCG